MSTSNQTYKELAIPYFKEVFDIIDRVLIREGVSYYLIGVSAIALELVKSGVRPGRGTKDIDFALMVSTMAEYDGIIKTLLDEGFITAEDAPWTIYHPEYNVAVDLLPFGQVEENDTISFHERHSELYVLGFQEVLAHTNPIEIDEKVIQVPPLPGMVILKLVAWSDRPAERDNDLTDILKIVEEYYEHEWNEIVDTHHDLLERIDDVNGQLKIAARVLGRQAKEYLLKSETLSTRILGLLEEQLTSAESSAIARQWAAKKDIEVEEALAILKECETGIKE